MSKRLHAFAAVAAAFLCVSCGSRQLTPAPTPSSQTQPDRMTCPRLGDGELLYLVVKHIQDGAYADKPLPDPKRNLQRDGYSYLGADGHLKPYKQIRAERESISELGNQLENWLNNNERGGFAVSDAEYVLRALCTKN